VRTGENLASDGGQKGGELMTKRCEAGGGELVVEGEEGEGISAISETEPAAENAEQESMIRHSSLRPGAKRAAHRVQFSLDDTAVGTSSQPGPISYSQWINKGMGRLPASSMGVPAPGGVFESSFTGQPVQVLPSPATVSSHDALLLLRGPPGAQASNTASMPTTTTAVAKAGAVSSPPPKPEDDEPRRWTEKARSRSTQPRGSEIDEIMGSSKTKRNKSRFAVRLPLPSHGAQPPAIRRRSRVEMYEADRKKKNRQQASPSGGNSRFSFGRIIRHLQQQFPSSSSSSSSLMAKSASASDLHEQHRKASFMDEEHEREILERGGRAARPDIVHPMDLNGVGAVEVVRINHFAKQPGRRPPPPALAPLAGRVATASATHLGPTGAVVTRSILKTKVEYSDSKDSGHESSSANGQDDAGDDGDCEGGDTSSSFDDDDEDDVRFEWSAAHAVVAGGDVVVDSTVRKVAALIVVLPISSARLPPFASFSSAGCETALFFLPAIYSRLLLSSCLSRWQFLACGRHFPLDADCAAGAGGGRLRIRLDLKDLAVSRTRCLISAREKKGGDCLTFSELISGGG